MTDVHRPGRVDASELHLHALAAPEVARAETLAVRSHLCDQAVQPLIGEPEVDVAAGRLGGRGAVGYDDRARDSLGDLGRRLAQLSGELEPRRAGVVAVRRFLGAAELEVGQLTLNPQPADGLGEGLADAAPDAHPRLFGPQQVGCTPTSVSWTWVEVFPRE